MVNLFSRRNFFCSPVILRWSYYISHSLYQLPAIESTCKDFFYPLLPTPPSIPFMFSLPTPPPCSHPAPPTPPRPPDGAPHGLRNGDLICFGSCLIFLVCNCSCSIFFTGLCLLVDFLFDIGSVLYFIYYLHKE